MFVTRKTYNELAEAYRKTWDEADDLRLELTSSQNGHEHALQDLAYWRQRAEAAESSPEVKADTEAAFQRGYRQSQRNFATWLRDECLKLQNHLDLPEVSGPVGEGSRD